MTTCSRTRLPTLTHEISGLGRRVADGALMLAFMSAAASRLTTACAEKTGPGGPTALSLGFDKVRFLKPVFFGDTLTTTYHRRGHRQAP